MTRTYMALLLLISAEALYAQNISATIDGQTYQCSRKGSNATNISVLVKRDAYQCSETQDNSSAERHCDCRHLDLKYGGVVTYGFRYSGTLPKIKHPDRPVHVPVLTEGGKIRKLGPPVPYAKCIDVVYSHPACVR